VDAAWKQLIDSMQTAYSKQTRYIYFKRGVYEALKQSGYVPDTALVDVAQVQP
jgi:hypothetical protein